MTYANSVAVFVVDKIKYSGGDMLRVRKLIQQYLLQVFSDGKCKVRKLPLPKSYGSSGVIHIVKESEWKMGILLLGVTSEAGSLLPLASDITVIVNGIPYAAKTHSMVRGRVGALTRIFRIHNIKPGDTLMCKYNPEKNILYVETSGYKDENKGNGDTKDSCDEVEDS